MADPRSVRAFSIHTFDPPDSRRLLEHAGLEVLDVIGKTVLPMRRYRELLEDSKARRRWLKIEKGLAGDPANLQGAPPAVRGEKDRVVAE